MVQFLGSTIDINELNAGRDVIGGVAGRDNVVEVNDVKHYEQTINQAECIKANAKLVEALVNGRKKIDEHEHDPDEKKLAVEAYEGLTAELSKKEPRKAFLTKLWNRFAATVTTIKPYVELGAMVAKVYGLDHTGMHGLPQLPSS